MPLSILDPITALLVVDLQKGIVALAAADPVAEVIKNARALADAFRARGLPVVLVNVDGRPPGRTEQARNFGDLPSDWTDLVPALNQQPRDHLVTKRTAGAFTRTGLADYLQGAGATQVVVAGVATSFGVESTARQAHELGLHVTLAVDAMTDPSPDAHHNSVTRIFPRLGETGTTREIIALLANASSTAERNA